jgi:uncharacterized repeat protein (TIGR02543 family)
MLVTELAVRGGGGHAAGTKGTDSTVNIDTTNGTYYTRAGAGGGGGGSSAIWTTDDTLIIAKGGNGGKGGDFGGDIGRLPPQSQSRPIWGWFEGASGGAGGGTSSIGGVYSLSDVTANTSAATVTQGAVKITRFTLPLYSITYHFNGGMPTTQVGEYYSIATTPTTVTLPSVTCQGFGFGGWYDNATFSGAPVTSFPIADKINKEFFAKWTAYTLYISYNNGSDEALGLSPSPAAALYGNTVIIPANPYTREHFKFYGWRVTGDGAGGVVIGAGEYTTANALSTALATKSTSVTLTAVWIPEEVFTITYHLDGGAPTAPLTETYTEFETGIVPLPSLTKTGYTFDGWYADETFTEQIFECEIPDPKGSPDDTIDIWAKFTIDTFDVDFVVGNGDTIDPQTVDYYGTVERPDADPVRDHYTFGGWYADGNFETPYDFDSPVVADLTIYAKWIVDTFAVTFETGAGAAIDNQSVDWNTALKKPTDPIYDGHHVVAWYTDDEFENEYDFETLVTGDLTLWADYAINIYTVSFQTFGGSTVDDQQVEWMDIVIAPDTDPTCAGFIFGGWYTDDEF